MDRARYEAYKARRRDAINASYALQFLRIKDAKGIREDDPLEKFGEGKDSAEWPERGFIVCAKIEPDNYTRFQDSVEFLGKVHWSKERPQVKHEVRLVGKHVGRGAETVWLELDNDNSTATLRAYFRANKYGKARAEQLAQEQVASIVQRVRDAFDDGWYMAGVVVTVRIDGREVARESLWGIESDSGEYFAETARELADTALDDARQFTRKLCATVGEQA